MQATLRITEDPTRAWDDLIDGLVRDGRRVQGPDGKATACLTTLAGG